jgi:diguanylate cyclase
MAPIGEETAAARHHIPDADAAVPALDVLMTEVEGFDSAEQAELAVRSALRDARLRGGPVDLERGVDTAALLARLVSTVQRLERRAEEAEAAALSDPLTDLANRRAWRRALRAEEERYRRGGPPAVVAVVDVDDFKSVNDQAGHAAGDAVLVLVARTLRHASRAGDVVARTGGDEFAVLAVGSDDVQRVGQRLRSALEAAGVRCSIGVASRPPTNSLGDAWDDADRRMYADKATRRG